MEEWESGQAETRLVLRLFLTTKELQLLILPMPESSCSAGSPFY